MASKSRTESIVDLRARTRIIGTLQIEAHMFNFSAQQQQMT